MNVHDVIRDLALADNDLPRESMQWALDNWEAAGPSFIELLSRCADGADRSEATKNALFFVIHLLGEKREAKSFPALCRLLEDAEACEAVLGDAITETLRGVIIGTYNGDPTPLKRVIESGAADEFVRAAALDAMAYLTRTGAFSNGEMRDYLMYLRAEMRPQADCFIWTAWALTVANLGYREFSSEVEQLILRGFIGRRDMDMADFDTQLRRTLTDPEGLGGFKHDRIGPFTDSIGTLSTWYGFSEQFKLDQARRAAEREQEDEASPWPFPDEPYIDPFRHVGRNDPCPCGSGKKYKKCCLQ